MESLIAVQDNLSPPNLALPHQIYTLFSGRSKINNTSWRDIHELERDKTVKTRCGGVALFYRSVSGKNCLVPLTQCDQPILVIHYLRHLIPSTPSLMHCASRNTNPRVSEMPVNATRQGSAYGIHGCGRIGR